MATYKVYIGKREYQIEISKTQVLINGEPVDANLLRLNDLGLYLLKRGEQQRELHVHSKGNSTYAIMTNGRHIIAQVEREGVGNAKRDKAQAEGDLVAPMPGMVVSVPVKEGEMVDKGQVLVVLESMKMQMEIRAPFAGRVIKLSIEAKSLVDKGTLLAQVGQS
ncbi:MAG: biotin/lipoyl-binding protein [Chloroflexi bacterium]|jgi:biotin carboxyl carrier protein|nr:biotin/lipoyl-containing protein [Anaerolineaceae bacterium]NMB87936.1 biotin/lipoyl-binding protein [Chloroflexota bacterium]